MVIYYKCKDQFKLFSWNPLSLVSLMPHFSGVSNNSILLFHNNGFLSSAVLSSISFLNTQEATNGGAVKLINVHNKMKKVLQALGIGSLVTGGLAAGFNLGMLIGYIKDTKLGESKIDKIPPFPV